MTAGIEPRTAAQPAATSAGRWSVETRRADSSLAGLRAAWDDLYNRCSAATPFQSHAWLESWWQTYGARGRLRLVLVWHGGRLVAAAAMMRVRRWSCAVLTPLGGALSDFTDVLLDDTVGATAARMMAQELQSQWDWQAIHFPETRPGAAAVQALVEAWPGRHWRVPASARLESPASPVDDLVRQLPSDAKEAANTRLDQIRRLGIDVRSVDAEETDRALADLLRLHAAQDGRGANRAHLRPDLARHLAAATPDLIASGRARLLEYRVGDRLIASNLVLVGSDLATGYVYGADPMLRDQVDITALLVSTTSPLAHSLGCSAVTMPRGAEPDETRWRAREVVNEQVLLARHGSARASAYAGVVRARGQAVRAADERMPWLRDARDRAGKVAARVRTGRTR